MSYGKWMRAWLGWINSQSVLGGLAGNRTLSATSVAQDGTGDVRIKKSVK